MATETLAPEAATPEQTIAAPAVETTPTTPTSPTLSRAEKLAALMEAMNKPPTEAEPEPEAEAEPVTAPTGLEPSEEEAEPEEEHDEPEVPGKPSKSFRGKWDHLDAQERRVIELTTKKGLTLKEANQAVYGASQPQAATPQVDPVAAVDATISSHEAEIESLDLQIAEASYDPETQAALRKQQKELNRKIGKLEASKDGIASQKQQSEQQQADSAYQESFQRSLDAYPEAYTVVENKAQFNRTTPIGRWAYAKDRELRTANNPVIHDADYHEYLLDQASVSVGHQPMQAPAAPVARDTQPVPQVALKRNVRPVPVGGIEPTTPNPQQEIDAARGSKNRESMLAAMSKHGTPFRI